MKDGVVFHTEDEIFGVCWGGMIVMISSSEEDCHREFAALQKMRAEMSAKSIKEKP